LKLPQLCAFLWLAGYATQAVISFSHFRPQACKHLAFILDVHVQGIGAMQEEIFLWILSKNWFLCFRKGLILNCNKVVYMCLHYFKYNTNIYALQGFNTKSINWNKNNIFYKSLNIIACIVWFSIISACIVNTTPVSGMISLALICKPGQLNPTSGNWKQLWEYPSDSISGLHPLLRKMFHLL
jgi:hypothetical protein